MAREPRTWTETRCRDLNQGVRGLLRSLQRNRHRERLTDLPSDDQEAIRDCLEVVEIVLWKLGFHYRSDVQGIEAAVLQVRMAFAEYMRRIAGGGLIERWLARMSLRFRPLRVWLFLRLHEGLEELDQRVGKVQLSAMPERDTFPSEVTREPDPIMAKVRESSCNLRRRLKSEVTDRARAPSARMRRWLAEPCLRACDLLVLQSVGFREREMEQVLGFDHTTISEWARKCQKLEEALHEEAGKQKLPAEPLNSRKSHA